MFCNHNCAHAYANISIHSMHIESIANAHLRYLCFSLWMLQFYIIKNVKQSRKNDFNVDILWLWMAAAIPVHSYKWIDARVRLFGRPTHSTSSLFFSCSPHFSSIIQSLFSLSNAKLFYEEKPNADDLFTFQLTLFRSTNL